MGKRRICDMDKAVETKTFLSEETIAALKANDVEELKYLRESGEPLGLCDPSGNNLLHLAIQYSQKTSTIEAFEYLLTLSEINKENLNFEENSPLMCAFLEAKDNPEYAIRLLESGCKLFIFPNGNSTLHIAARNDWPEVMEFLIENGIDIDTRNNNGATALHYAAQSHNTDIVWMLLFYGADPNLARRFIDTTTFTHVDLTFFDIIRYPGNELSLDQFAKFDKVFSLRTLLNAMVGDDDSFYQLVEMTYDVFYHIIDLNFLLDKIFTFKSNLFRVFIEEFGFVLDDAFQNFTSKFMLAQLFRNFHPTMLENLCANLMVLLESSMSSIVIDELSSSDDPLLTHIIRFAAQVNQIELLTKVLCCFLSYGAELTPEAMEELFTYFGYFKLFAIMLHMNIEKKTECDMFWSQIFYDMEIDLDNFLSGLSYYEATSFHLNKYCTAPVICHLRFPSLTELARNASRKAIIKKFQPKNSMEFYTILYRLPIGRVFQDIIAYARPIYAMRYMPRKMTI